MKEPARGTEGPDSDEGGTALPSERGGEGAES